MLRQQPNEHSKHPLRTIGSLEFQEKEDAGWDQAGGSTSQVVFSEHNIDNAEIPEVYWNSHLQWIENSSKSTRKGLNTHSRSTFAKNLTSKSGEIVNWSERGTYQSALFMSSNEFQQMQTSSSLTRMGNLTSTYTMINNNPYEQKNNDNFQENLTNSNLNHYQGGHIQGPTGSSDSFSSLMPLKTPQQQTNTQTQATNNPQDTSLTSIPSTVNDDPTSPQSASRPLITLIPCPEDVDSTPSNRDGRHFDTEACVDDRNACEQAYDRGDAVDRAMSYIDASEDMREMADIGKGVACNRNMLSGEPFDGYQVSSSRLHGESEARDSEKHVEYSNLAEQVRGATVQEDAEGIKYVCVERSKVSTRSGDRRSRRRSQHPDESRIIEISDNYSSQEIDIDSKLQEEPLPILVMPQYISDADKKIRLLRAHIEDRGSLSPMHTAQQRGSRISEQLAYLTHYEGKPEIRYHMATEDHAVRLPNDDIVESKVNQTEIKFDLYIIGERSCEDSLHSSQIYSTSNADNDQPSAIETKPENLFSSFQENDNPDQFKSVSGQKDISKSESSNRQSYDQSFDKCFEWTTNSDFTKSNAIQTNINPYLDQDVAAIDDIKSNFFRESLGKQAKTTEEKATDKIELKNKHKKAVSSMTKENESLPVNESGISESHHEHSGIKDESKMIEDTSIKRRKTESTQQNSQFDKSFDRQVALVASQTESEKRTAAKELRDSLLKQIAELTEKNEKLKSKLSSNNSSPYQSAKKISSYENVSLGTIKPQATEKNIQIKEKMPYTLPKTRKTPTIDSAIFYEPTKTIPSKLENSSIENSEFKKKPFESHTLAGESVNMKLQNPNSSSDHDKADIYLTRKLLRKKTSDKGIESFIIHDNLGKKEIASCMAFQNISIEDIRRKSKSRSSSKTLPKTNVPITEAIIQEKLKFITPRKVPTLQLGAQIQEVTPPKECLTLSGRPPLAPKPTRKKIKRSCTYTDHTNESSQNDVIHYHFEFPRFDEYGQVLERPSLPIELEYGSKLEKIAKERTEKRAKLVRTLSSGSIGGLKGIVNLLQQFKKSKDPTPKSSSNPNLVSSTCPGSGLVKKSGKESFANASKSLRGTVTKSFKFGSPHK